MKHWFAVIVLVLLASLVVGREPPPASPRKVLDAPKGPETLDLDLAKLHRERKASAISDVFALPASPAPPPAPARAPAAEAKPEPPAPPQAPPLPFKYLGRMVRSDATLLYLVRNDQLYVAQAGEMLDGQYQVESISQATAHIVYLPLGIRQTLDLPAAP
jgi:hypothetical protein